MLQIHTNTNIKKKNKGCDLFWLLIVLDMRHVLDKLEPEKGDSYDTKKSKYNDFFTSDMTGCDFDFNFFF